MTPSITLTKPNIRSSISTRTYQPEGRNMPEGRKMRKTGIYGRSEYAEGRNMGRSEGRNMGRPEGYDPPPPAKKTCR